MCVYESYSVLVDSFRAVRKWLGFRSVSHVESRRNLNFVFWSKWKYFFSTNLFYPQVFQVLCFPVKTGKIWGRAALALPCSLSSLAEHKQQEKGKASQQQLQGKALFSVLKKGNFMWCISWVSSGQWLPAVVCFRNVCLKSGLGVWCSPSTQPCLMSLLKKKKACPVCLIINYVPLLSVRVFLLKEKKKSSCWDGWKLETDLKIEQEKEFS